jgi:carboxyl-terminal processing protease
MKKLIILFFLAVLVTSSCKKDVSTSTLTDAQKGRDALYSLMKEWYYWYLDMPLPVTLSDYKDPYELLEKLRYKQLDRWSFVADYKTFVASMQGTFVGHGIRVGLDPSGKARIVTIYQNSPLYKNGAGGPGVRRGWIIKSLNGQDLAAVLEAQDATAYNNLFGPSSTTRSNTFVFTTPGGYDTTATSTKASFQVNSVMLYDTIHIQNKIAGHLVFDEFIDPSSAELQTAFAYFSAQGVNELILDMRYNNGGILDVATELASYIAGTTRVGSTFITSEYNDKKAATENSTTKFKTMLYPLNITRLVVITTRETASASEEVINGLRAYIPVTTIGDTTNGKPTGMNVWQYNSKYIFAPITFKCTNKKGEGDYFDGFAPDKYVTDDITHDFRDKSELCFKEAIYFIEHGTVSAKGAYIYKPSVQFSEKPAWMGNAYILDKSILNK